MGDAQMNAPTDELAGVDADAAASRQMSDLIRSEAGRSAVSRHAELSAALAELDAAKASGDEARIMAALDVLIDRARDVVSPPTPDSEGVQPPATSSESPGDSFNQAVRAARHAAS